ncbi:uncharacterized protein LOC125040801 [Penaeus chinensis]|uniref:uncharacterized protein LOC125040801 n=1 Tax=Penaeus chinensis TaxID=139456 RepID=UPI001FB76DF8|nr:uncharacterized protein LOC125040801 [Penaeus chinensis]
MVCHPFAVVLASLVLAAASSLSVLEKSTVFDSLQGQLDNLEESENLLKISKRHAEIHHVAKREAKVHAVYKRQASGKSRLESLQLRTALMFIEADQAADIAVALELAEVFNKINSTLQAGRGGRVDDFERRLQAIAVNVSANSVLPKDCGRSASDSGDVLRGSHPWVVSVGFKNGDRDVIGCVAVVISRYHVITNAICAATTKYDHVILKNTAYKVANRWFHPSLKSDDDVTNGHNIGIVMTESPIKFNDEVQPACLPGISDVVDPAGQGSTTLVGFEDGSSGGVTKYSWVNSKTFGSLLCFEALGSLGSSSTQNSLYTLLSRHHLCVLRPFKEAELSVAVDQDPRTGRVQVTGVGPVTDPSSNTPMAFTLTQTHTFWLELMVKNSIRLLL